MTETPQIDRLHSSTATTWVCRLHSSSVYILSSHSCFFFLFVVAIGLVSTYRMCLYGECCTCTNTLFSCLGWIYVLSVTRESTVLLCLAHSLHMCAAAYRRCCYLLAPEENKYFDFVFPCFREFWFTLKCYNSRCVSISCACFVIVSSFPSVSSNRQCFYR